MVGFFCFAQLRVILAHLRVDLVPFRVASAHRRVIPRLFTAPLFRVAALVRRFSVAAPAAFRVTLVLSRRKAKCLNRRGKGEAFKP